MRGPAWGTLRNLVLGRMLVASLALPSGLLLRPDFIERPMALLALALAAVAAVSVAWMLGRRLKRGFGFQVIAQLGVDLALVRRIVSFQRAAACAS